LRLKFKHLIEKILQKYNPAEGEWRAKTISERRTEITYSGFIDVYGKAIKLIQKFEINVEPYRQNILFFLMYNRNDINEIIFEIIPDPTKEEINNLLFLYKSRRDDDLQRNIRPLIDICEKHPTEAAPNILKGIIGNKKSTVYYDVTRAIDVLDSLGDYIQYFDDLFDVYAEEYKVNQGQDIYAKLKCINRILLRVNSKKAFEWLTKDILIKKKLSSNRPHRNGIRPYESDGRDEGKDLYEVQHIHLKNQMLDLLAKSCEFINENGLYYEYFRNAVWQPVSQYFINLKSEKHLIKSHLRDIHDALSNFIGTKAYKWFQGHLDNIRDHYIKELSQADKIPDAII